MSSLTRDGNAEPVSRDQILRRERGQKKRKHFPSLADHEQDWQLTRLILTLVMCDDHTYIYESFNDLGGRGRGRHNFVPVLGGDGTKVSPTGDLFDQSPREMS